MPMHTHLKSLTELVPDLPLRHALPVLEWVSGLHGAIEQQASGPDAGAIRLVMDPPPAPPVPAGAGNAASDALRGAPWTEAERARAWQLKGEGYTARQIADELGRTLHGTEVALKRIRAEGVSGQRSRIGLTGPGPKCRPSPWSSAEITRARELRNAGQSYEQIAAAVGRTAKAVEVALSRHRYEEKAADVAPEPSGQTQAQPPVAADVGDQPECTRGAVGFAEAGTGEQERGGDVPALVADEPAAGDAGQPTGHGDLGGLDVADAAAVVPAAVVPAPEPAPRLTRRQNLLVDHLGRMNDDFTPEDDLFLVEELAKGVPGNIVADQLGVDLKTIGLRFRALQIEDILNDKGRLTIDGQADLLIALRYRAGRDA